MNFFLQTCLCEELQEEVANLKQQLSDALELVDISSVTSHMQKSSESPNKNKEKVIEAQVKFSYTSQQFIVNIFFPDGLIFLFPYILIYENLNIIFTI